MKALKNYIGNLTGARVRGQKANVTRAKQTKEGANVAAESAKASHAKQSSSAYKNRADAAQKQLDEYFPKNDKGSRRKGKRIIKNRGKKVDGKAPGKTMTADQLRKARNTNLKKAEKGDPRKKMSAKNQKAIDDSNKANEAYEGAIGKLNELRGARYRARKGTAIGAAAVGVTGAGVGGYKYGKDKGYFEARLENMEFALNDQIDQITNY